MFELLLHPKSRSSLLRAGGLLVAAVFVVHAAIPPPPPPPPSYTHVPIVPRSLQSHFKLSCPSRRDFHNTSNATVPFDKEHRQTPETVKCPPPPSRSNNLFSVSLGISDVRVDTRIYSVTGEFVLEKEKKRKYRANQFSYNFFSGHRVSGLNPERILQTHISEGEGEGYKWSY